MLKEIFRERIALWRLRFIRLQVIECPWWKEYVFHIADSRIKLKVGWMSLHERYRGKSFRKWLNVYTHTKLDGSIYGKWVNIGGLGTGYTYSRSGSIR